MNITRKKQLAKLLNQYKLNQASLKAPMPIRSKANVTISDQIDVQVVFKYSGNDLRIQFKFPNDIYSRKDTFQNGYMLHILETAQQYFSQKYDCDVQAIDLITFYDVEDQKQLDKIIKDINSFLNKIKNFKTIRSLE